LSEASEEVLFDNDVYDEVGSLLHNKDIKTRDIIERIKMLVSEEKHVDSVCHLYMMLCFAVLSQDV